KRHSVDYYYEQRDAVPDALTARAARFIYLNRACWNGLYRVNKRGHFNVPVGTKDWVLSADDDFAAVSEALQNADLVAGDFEEPIAMARSGDVVFADPPYTVAHNYNGFVKYNDAIFSWDDQVRLRDCLALAVSRGAIVFVTNADHPSIRQLYEGIGHVRTLARHSVISGHTKGRGSTTEVLIE